MFDWRWSWQHVLQLQAVLLPLLLLPLLQLLRLVDIHVKLS